MESPTFPGPDVLLARLGTVEQPLTGENLRRLAERLGMRGPDLFLVAGLAVPDDELLLDEEAGRELPRLVRHALRAPAPGRRRLRDRARSLSEAPRHLALRQQRPYEQYPPGYGSLLVRMLALRNLGWSSAAKVMSLMSGVHLSAATIGAVGRGTKQLDAELLHGFAAVLGIPVDVLARLTGVRRAAESGGLPTEVADTAALLWDVRHLTADQVRDLSRLAAHEAGP
ncbi:hypothetical protein ACIHAR_04370 [Streptomyces sp. NPDC052016]|uniref:hypothetical protein n=1 Tax=unclassified Streptomyces TaxID=2593676 RepID=UPI00341EA1FC